MSLANIITLASEAEAQQAGYRNARNCPWVRHVSAHCPRQFPGVLAGVLFSAILMSGLPKSGGSAPTPSLWYAHPCGVPPSFVRHCRPMDACLMWRLGRLRIEPALYT